MPIVGLGASAGGLEALEGFLKNVPANSGLAFVVVQHLDPVRVGLLPELLQRGTTMKVVPVKDRTRVRPDCVYVIPPNRDMSLLHGVLHLLEPTAPRGLRLPIDFFFRSLADDQRERSVGVVLSGMGGDGTAGLRAIKERAGLALVQEPASAKFDSMPRSAIDAGLADVVAPAEALPARLLAYLQQSPPARTAAPRERVTPSQIDKVVILLRSRTGHDFSLYKRSTLCRRIERRMSLHQIPKLGTYVRYLRENPSEVDLLFKELLIGVTSFFRDPAAWEQLRDEALPRLLQARAGGSHALRAWVPGCSTGEEAYTLAIVFKEVLEQVQPRGSFSLQIFATDLDRDAVNHARQGHYPASIAAGMSAGRLQRFFVKVERGYRVAKDIREMIIFAQQNLVMDPPFTKLDILSCRNLLIYFTSELQKRLFPLFHYSLNPGGVLLLGSAESVAGLTASFVPFRGQSRLFHRADSGPKPEAVEFPSTFAAATPAAPRATRRPNPPPASLQNLAEQWLLKTHAPAAVLVNDSGDILFISGRTGRYLEPAAGKANWNVFVMARDSLRYELGSMFQQARRQPGPVTARQLRADANGGGHFVDVTVQFLAEPEGLRGLAMIVFAGVAAPGAEEKRLSAGSKRRPDQRGELERQLRQAREEVQSTREAMQTSQEELKSMNEELQSTNEELQSANEELTTSKEEMQSLNEELQTVNAELQAKVDELNAASNDMINLLNSTEIATVFLDHALRVRRFTEQAVKLFNFIPGDIGRPVTDLASDLQYTALAADAGQVLRTLAPVERTLATGDGRWFAMRLMPYRTLDNRIDGVVITFSDITTVKRLEAGFRARAGGEK